MTNRSPRTVIMTPPPCLQASCLCGSVAFEIVPPFRDLINCYCSECRKNSGNFVTATAIQPAQIHWHRKETLRWYRNEISQRGFCGECGSSLFWKHRVGDEDKTISVMAGCLQPNTGMQIRSNWYVDDRSDFHVLDPALPRTAGAVIEAITVNH